MKKILFVGTAFPPAKAGSAVVMRELLKQLDIESYRVIGIASDGSSEDQSFESRTFRVGSRLEWAGGFALWLRFVNAIMLKSKALRFARVFQPDLVVAPFPSLDFLFLGGIIAKKLRVPFVPYLHDTIAEASENGRNRYLTRWVQKYVFKNATKVLVISEGMAELYKRKYNINAVTVPHIYNERTTQSNGGIQINKSAAFWAGSVYGINDKALKRVFEAMTKLNMTLGLTDRENKAHLSSLGIRGDNIQIHSLPSRVDYLDFMSKQGVLVLALNFPDETGVGHDELATIFPTKTPEYLAAGRPIVVHCPEHYFLARFFREKKCGIVVSDKTINDLVAALKYIDSNVLAVKEMCNNARAAAEMFSPYTVVAKFKEGINDVLP